MHPAFSVGESLRFGWEKFKAHNSVLLQAMLIIFALEIASGIIQATLQGTLLGAAGIVIIAVLELFAGAGLTLMALRLAEGHPVHLRELFPHWRVTLKFYCASVLAALVILVPVLVGVILAGALWSFSGSAASMFLFAAVLVIVGVCALYLALRYAQVRFAILDGESITGSLRRSAALMNNVKWRFLWLLLILIVSNIVGAILLLVGLLITVPVSMLALAHVYLRLKHRT